MYVASPSVIKPDSSGVRSASMILAETPALPGRECYPKAGRMTRDQGHDVGAVA